MTKGLLYAVLAAAAAVPPAMASPLSSTAKSTIPREVQQIIVVDYRSLNAAPAALALKEKVLPAPLRQFELALRGAGIHPETDIEQIVFASYRGKQGLRFVGVAMGQFSDEDLLNRLKAKKIKGEKYRSATIYPMGSGLAMSLLDPANLLFGDIAVLKEALDARDGEIRSLNANAEILDLMGRVESEVIWSVLDEQGTQTMMKSALGEAAELADFEVVKKRLKGARYSMNFNSGVVFDMDVVTSDTFTAATLSSLLKAGMMIRKSSAGAAERLALDTLEVKSESQSLQLKFKTDERHFRALLNSELFGAVTK